MEFNEQFLEIKSDSTLDTAPTNDQMNVDVTQQVDDLTNINNNNNIEIIGTHLLLPQNSISQMVITYRSYTYHQSLIICLKKSSL